MTTAITWAEQHAICIYLHGFVFKGSNRLYFLPLCQNLTPFWHLSEPESWKMSSDVNHCGISPCYRIKTVNKMKSTQCAKNKPTKSTNTDLLIYVRGQFPPTKLTVWHRWQCSNTLIEMFPLKLLQCVCSLLATVPFWGRPHYTWKRHMEHTSAVSPGCWRARKCDSASFAPAAAPRRDSITRRSLLTRVAAHTRLSRSIFFPHQSNTLPNDFLSQTETHARI